MKLEFKFIISLVFAILVAIFAIQNASSVDVNFFLWKFSISQAIVIFGSAIVGGIIVLLLGLIKQIRQNMRIKKITKENEIISKENKELRIQLDELKKTKEIENQDPDNVIEQSQIEENDTISEKTTLWE